MSWFKDVYPFKRTGDAPSGSGISVPKAIKVELKTKVFDEITKSPRDDRLYRGLELGNRMKILLVSDASILESALSLCVPCGYLCDPSKLPGLANLTQRMILAGSYKYPETNSFEKFLHQNDGDFFVETSSDTSDFHVEIAPMALDAMLERFAEFFVDPTFPYCCLQAKVKEVDELYKKMKESSEWKVDNLTAGTASPEHRFSRCPLGTKADLWTNPTKDNQNLRDIIMKYYEMFYSSNLMTLAVIGPQSLDELQAMVEPRFSRLRNRQWPFIQIPQWPVNPFGSEELQQKLEVSPGTDVQRRELIVLFPLPADPRDTLRTQYLSHLICCEGPGSLTHVLEENFLGFRVNSWTNVGGRGFACFMIQVHLTTKGLQEWERVVTHIFQFLDVLRETPPMKWVWQELATLKSLTFRFRERSEEKAIYVVSHAAIRLQDYAFKEVLHSEEEFDPHNISMQLSSLFPERCRVTIIANEFHDWTEITHPWCEADYNRKQISPELLRKWQYCQKNPALSFPVPNPFIPEVTELKPHPELVPGSGVIPNLIRDTSLTRIWHFQDKVFKLPKAFVFLKLQSRLPRESPMDYNMNTLLARFLESSLKDNFYNIRMADANLRVASDIVGLEFHMEAYDSKIGMLTDLVIGKLLEECPAVTDEKFQIEKQCLEEYLHREALGPTPQHSYELLNKILFEVNWTNAELYEAMQGVTLELFNDYLKRFLQRLTLRWLVYGNVTSAEATRLVDDCTMKFEKIGTVPLPYAESRPLGEVEIPEGRDFIFVREFPIEAANCLSVYFQAGLQTPMNNALVELLVKVVSSELRKSLKENEDEDFVHVDRQLVSQGVTFSMACELHPNLLYEELKGFLQKMDTVFQAMTQDEFQKHKDTLVVSAFQSSHSETMRQAALEFWSELRFGRCHYTWQKEELAALRTLTLDQLREFFNEHLGPRSNRKRSVSVQIKSIPLILAANEPQYEDYDNDQCFILDIDEWKQDQAYFLSTLQ